MCLDSQTRSPPFDSWGPLLLFQEVRWLRLNILQVLGWLHCLCWWFSPLKIFCAYGWRTVFIQVLHWEIPPSCSRDLGPLHLFTEFFSVYRCICQVSACSGELKVTPGFGGNRFSCPFWRELIPFSSPPCCCVCNPFITALLSCLFQIKRQRITIHQIHW